VPSLLSIERFNVVNFHFIIAAASPSGTVPASALGDVTSGSDNAIQVMADILNIFSLLDSSIFYNLL
jgi:hypothetical protein